MLLQCDNASNCVLHLIARGRKFNIGSSDAKFDTFCVNTYCITTRYLQITKASHLSHDTRFPTMWQKRRHR